mmetsp:Transcript_170544/g.541769  ORF Transcript_170544/g.541769 Transcript_170544/m.541769 type:complete len:288 (-) Transcript_170544:90-953(-)
MRSNDSSVPGLVILLLRLKMDLLGGYGSDGSDDGSDEERPAAAQPAGPKRRKVDFSKLPVSRPVDFSSARGGAEEEAPLKRAAELDNSARFSIGRNLLAAIPPPKVTLGKDTSLGGGGSGGARLDLDFLPKREKPRVFVSDLIKQNGGVDDIEDDPSAVPEKMANHPMFSNQLKQDGPSQQDLAILRKDPKFIKISQAEMQDPDWWMKNQIAGGPGLHPGKSVPEEVSMYEAKTWKKTTHADPSRIQKRKHQINWLANEALENEAEMLDRNSSGKLSKAQTSAKYGW